MSDESLGSNSEVVKLLGSSTNQIASNEPKKQKVTLYLLFAAFVICLGSFQFGYNVGVTNAPQEAISGFSPGLNITQNVTLCDDLGDGMFFKPCVWMDKFMYSVFVSVFVLGALIGGIFAGPVSDMLGRRTTLFFANVFFIIGSLMLALLSNFYVFVSARFLVGVGVGFISVVCPLYLAEISPQQYRGAIGAMHQFSIVGALLVVAILGIFLSNRPHWRFLLGLPAVIAALQMILLPFCPMSPRWLMSKGWTDSARVALKKYRQEDDVEEELDSCKSKEEKKGFIRTFLSVFRVGLIKPIFVGLVLHISQQFSGINAIMFYSTNIFKDAGIESATIATMIVGIVNFIASAISVVLIEKLGRRWLFIGSEVIAAISFTGLAVAYILAANNIAKQAMSIISVICIITYVGGFSIGMGPIPWNMLSELYPNDVRGLCQGAITAVNWLCTFIIALSFPSLSDLLKEYTFVPFAIFIWVAIVFAFFFVPETKGKSMEELTGGL